MSARSQERLLEHNIFHERIGLPNYCEIVNTSAVIEAPGSYFCDASEGQIVLTLAPRENVNEGCTFTFRKTDNTHHKVVVDATAAGGIEGMHTVELLIRFECLQVQLHNSALFMI